MSIAAKQEKASYEDYLTWPADERWEIIDGRPCDMTPAPSFKHQRVVGNLYHILRGAMHGERCIVGIAPTDVVLSEHDVVQPDVFVVCDGRKITDQNILGAPELVFEVLSPATAKKDRWEKKALYERAGVIEYVLVDPEGRYVERYLLGRDGRFDRGEVFAPDQMLPLRTLDGAELAVWEILGVDRPSDSVNSA
ncbi:MAG: Uma2 family endonuclease [Syntrophobacteraceae bacterium]